ncbi:hypothetical protein MMPV_009404 [Pyropia vietnamensis]
MGGEADAAAAGVPRALAVYCGVPNGTRGEGVHLSADPTGATDRVAYASGRTAVVRSLSSPLDAVVFTLHTSLVTVATLSPDGKSVLSADDTGYLRRWDAATGAQTLELQVMAGPVRDVAWSADGAYAAVCGDARGSYAKVIKLAGGGSLAGACGGHQKRVASIAIRPVPAGTQPTVATGSEDFSDANIPTFLKHHNSFIFCVRFSPDGATLAIASGDKTVSLVDAETKEVVRTLSGHKASVTAVAWSPDGTRLLTSSNDKTAKVWVVATGEVEATLTVGGTDVLDMQTGCAWTGAGSLVTSSLRGNLNVFSSTAPYTATSVLRGHSKQIVGVAVPPLPAPTGSIAYSADYSGQLVVWELGVGAADAPFTGKGHSTGLCALATNAEFVITTGQDGNVFLTPTATLAIPKSPLTVRGGGVALAVPSSSHPAYTTVTVNESRLCLLSTESTVADIPFARGEKGTAVATTTDGTALAVGVEVSGGAGELRFATVSSSGDVSWRKDATASMPSAPNVVAYSPDGSTVAVGEKNRRVKFYDAATGSPRSGGSVAHTARVDAIAWSPDATRVASGGLDGTLAIVPAGSGDGGSDEVRRVMGAHRGGGDQRRVGGCDDARDIRRRRLPPHVGGVRSQRQPQRYLIRRTMTSTLLWWGHAGRESLSARL